MIESIHLGKLTELLHDNLKSLGTGFPWTMELETGWICDDLDREVWGIRDGNGNIISWVRQQSNESMLWYYTLSILNKHNNGNDYYSDSAESFPENSITD